MQFPLLMLDIWQFCGKAFVLAIPDVFPEWTGAPPHITVIFLGEGAKKNNLKSLQQIALFTVKRCITKQAAATQSDKDADE